MTGLTITSFNLGDDGLGNNQREAMATASLLIVMMDT
jgi:hypothetical protein